MASLGLEKRAILVVEDGHDHALQTPHVKPARRRALPWLAFLLAVLATLSIKTAFRPCAASSSLSTNHDDPQAIISRSPTEPGQETSSTATTSAAAAGQTVLKTFEVAQPVLMPDGPAESDGSTRHGKDYASELCTLLLMRHDFAWSYDAPFVGDYTPPDCEFNRVVLNFSVVSHGRQFDRLAIMYFGDTEVWRTSTAEPTPPPGISWIYLKDMTEYLYFWKSPQKIIFDLGNLINDQYTGIFNTTMTAIFYHTDLVTDQAPPSDLIIPVSARHGANNSISRFMLPAEKATNTLSLPRNIRRAVFTVSANGQASEEFWWSNVLETDVYTFNATAGPLPGLSPFREVQVLIDGQLSGVQWPFPVIFTGGVAPALHRPIVGIQAFDLREHEIDITPFLPLLCDGQPHTFTIRVAGLNHTTPATLTETVNESWYVTGKLFLWLDPDQSFITTGSPPTIHAPPPIITTARALTHPHNGSNETLTYTVSAQRTLRITSPNSPSTPGGGGASWSQHLTYTNHALISAAGFTQHNNLLLTGTDTASSSRHSNSDSDPSPAHHPPHPYHYTYHKTHRHPLTVTSTYTLSPPPNGSLAISARLRQGREVAVTGASVSATGLEAFAGCAGRGLTARLETVREGWAEYRAVGGEGGGSLGWGVVGQGFWFGVGGSRVGVGSGLDGGGGGAGAGGDEGVGTGGGRGGELYYREVKAVNGTVVGDRRRMEGREVGGGGGERDEDGDGKGVVGVVALEYA